MDNLTKLVTFLKNWWDAIKSNLFYVRIENIDEFPEVIIPEVKIPEYPTEISITNLDQIKPIDKFADIVRAIKEQSKELKPQDKNVVGELKAILKELKKEKKDLTPEVVKKISELIKSVDSKSIDFSALENCIKDIYNCIENVKEYDEIKVKLNGKQFEKLSEKTATAISSGISGGAKESTQQEILEALTDSSGLSVEETMKQLLTTMNALLMKIPNLVNKPNVDSLYVYTDTTSSITAYNYERLDLTAANNTRFQLLDGPIQSQRNAMLTRGQIGF